MNQEIEDTKALSKVKSDMSVSENEKYLYEVKMSLITETEKPYLTAIKKALPKGYFVQPQVNLASIIYRTDGARYQNELYRNVDACIFDLNYKPIALVEINDNSHNDPKRKARDAKVKMICEEAGIPLMKFWTSYGVKEDYIMKTVADSIEKSKVPIRIAHSKNNAPQKLEETSNSKKQQGCYIATAVYGSYDCPQVWILRRFRDNTLSKSIFGSMFIKIYYSVSPLLVAKFSKKIWFNLFFKKILDKFVNYLASKGFSDLHYKDN